jgi:alanine dehydrogenase
MTRIGVPREIKTAERRVALTPDGVRELVSAGHEVIIEARAGVGAGFPDEAYERAGAQFGDRQAAWSSDLVVKVKEPVEDEPTLLSEDSVLFTYLHLAAAPSLIEALGSSRATAVAYETVELPDGSLPLLTPMSEVAGRLAAQAAASALLSAAGGRGVLMGGVAGVEPARVVVIGGGVVGINAARVALGMGAEVTVFDRSLPRLRALEGLLGGRVTLRYSTTQAVEDAAIDADAVIGAVLVAGARAPMLLSAAAVSRMREGAVIVDVAIDQGGCIETSRPTTHVEPTYVVSGVVHYCVANMPGAVPITSTKALTNATLPYVRALADLGLDGACAALPELAGGINIKGGEVVKRQVIESLALAA